MFCVVLYYSATFYFANFFKKWIFNERLVSYLVICGPEITHRTEEEQRMRSSCQITQKAQIKISKSKT